MRKWIALGAVAFVALWVTAWVAGTFNGFVNGEEKVRQTYAQVQNVLERQAELLPNMAKTVSAYANHEQRTFIETAAARARGAAQRPVNPQTGRAATDAEIANSAELQKQLLQNQAAVLAASQQALLAMNMVREAHPKLKADRLFSNLMSQLEGSQNRITTERRRNQLAVEEYNRSVRRVPGRFVAAAFGFAPLPYFEARADAQRAPTLEF